MKIGILGAGNVGGNLGRLWAARGHEIVFGVRDPNGDKIRALFGTIGGSARAASIREAAAFGEAVALAVPWAVVPETLAQTGDWAGKILIDSTTARAIRLEFDVGVRGLQLAAEHFVGQCIR